MTQQEVDTPFGSHALQVSLLTATAASVAALLLVPQEHHWRAARSSPIDTIPRVSSRVGAASVTIGGLIATAGFLLDLKNDLSKPAADLSAELRVDTLVVPSFAKDTASVFSDPWIRGSIVVRNGGTASARGVAVVSPVAMPGPWHYVFERVGARETASFIGGRLAAGSLPPGSWVQLSVWWRLGAATPPLTAYVIQHDAGTLRPVPYDNRNLIRSPLFLGTLLAGAGGLILSASTAWGRYRRRRATRGLSTG